MAAVSGDLMAIKARFSAGNGREIGRSGESIQRSFGAKERREGGGALG